MNTSGLRTWIEIDTKKLAHNIESLRHEIGSTKIMGVVKSNAYGHSLIEISEVLQQQKIDWLGVDSVTEAVRLREEGITLPILILGYTLPERITEAQKHTISITISSLEALASVQKLSLEGPLKIHIKVDTGLHRQGFLLNELQEVINILEKDRAQPQSAFIIEGLFTHFAAAKDPKSPEYTYQQLQKFNMWVEAFKQNGFSPIIHASATAGALLYPESRFDMIRCGAGMYGIWPSEETKLAEQQKINLEPILSWKTIISEIKKLPKGSGISYSLTEKLSRDSTIAICPIGYWHGFSRSLSSVGEVLIRGKRAKVLGIVAMDMIVIDITDISDVSVRNVVTVIGQDGTDEITLEEIAKKAGMTTYEFVTRLNSRIKRIFI